MHGTAGTNAGGAGGAASLHSWPTRNEWLGLFPFAAIGAVWVWHLVWASEDADFLAFVLVMALGGGAGLAFALWLVLLLRRVVETRWLRWPVALLGGLILATSAYAVDPPGVDPVPVARLSQRSDTAAHIAPRAIPAPPTPLPSSNTPDHAGVPAQVKEQAR